MQNHGLSKELLLEFLGEIKHLVAETEKLPPDSYPAQSLCEKYNRMAQSIERTPYPPVCNNIGICRIILGGNITDTPEIDNEGFLACCEDLEKNIRVLIQNSR